MNKNDPSDGLGINRLDQVVRCGDRIQFTTKNGQLKMGTVVGESRKYPNWLVHFDGNAPATKTDVKKWRVVKAPND